jgi:hypothetical protein
VSTGGNERLSCLLDLYDQGLSNREIGERFGLSAERIRQLLVSYGVVSRPASQRRFEAAVRGREEEIVAAYLRLGNEADVARETGLDEVHVQRVLTANLPEIQVLRRRKRTKPERYTEEEILSALREAARCSSSPLGYHTYRRWAARQRAEGLPCPSPQTVLLRLGRWREALARAGLVVPVGGGRPATYGRDSGVVALAQAWTELGQAPTIRQYEVWRSRRTELPAAVTIRRMATSWSDLLREAYPLIRRDVSPVQCQPAAQQTMGSPDVPPHVRRYAASVEALRRAERHYGDVTSAHATRWIDRTGQAAPRRVDKALERLADAAFALQRAATDPDLAAAPELLNDLQTASRHYAGYMNARSFAEVRAEAMRRLGWTPDGTGVRTPRSSGRSQTRDEKKVR